MKSNKKFILLILAVFFITIIIQYAHAADSPSITQETVPSGSETVPSGSETVPSGSETVPSGSETVPGGSVPGGQETVPGGSVPGGSVPGGSTGDAVITSDILGEKGGIFHPFIILEEVYTDNLFATNSNKKSSLITTIAPGVWLVFPGTKVKQLQIDTTITAPGGLHLSRIKPEGGSRRYQSYFLYSPEFIFNSGYSKHDHINHKAEALFQYNLNFGLSFDLIGVLNDREEVSGDGLSDTLYRHQDNLIDFITTYDPPSNKFKLQLALSNYGLDYKDTVVSNRDRTDKSYGISAFYKFWTKVDLFTEYNYSDIKFDSGTINDSIENRYYAGANWEITEKTNGLIKLGYIQKDFNSPSVTDQDGISFELRLQHEFNPKRSLQATGFRKFHESDMAAASSFLSTGIDVTLGQKFTEKWSASLGIFYKRNEYNGFDRNDDIFGFGPAIKFEPREWMFFDLGYFYYQSNSNYSFYDFDINQIYLRATLYM
ncbi:outer membrane beta-barrel protein [Desulfobacula sp.]|uniref:outer membrane beta-barrel protein n=1 Tax=Desulfobacula sp. TaxID=2593537 RepID=UPI001EBD5F20|nr:outer membrane beta-barrel protein [Desulfobacula sp.]